MKNTVQKIHIVHAELLLNQFTQSLQTFLSYIIIVKSLKSRFRRKIYFDCYFTSGCLPTERQFTTPNYEYRHCLILHSFS